MRLQETVVEFTGIDGAGDEPVIAAALMGVPGVHAVRVELGEGRAVVTGDAAIADPDALRAAIARAGYEVGEVWFAE